MNVLITGATGFVGSSLVNAISEIDGINIKAVVRNKNKSLNFPNNNIKLFCVPCITNFSDWDILLHNIDVVVHTAGKVHHRHKIAKQDIVDFYNINVCATRKLAACSIAAGVKRFIFISSVKVHGDITVKDWPFTEDMPLDPYGYYGLSKYNAEEALKEIAKTTGLEIVIIRPVLVYGNGVKANFKTMLNLLYKNFPLPFGNVDNLRSIVYIENLIDLIKVCMLHKAAANQIFLVSDGEDISTPDLLSTLSNMLGKKARLFTVNHRLLKIGLHLTNNSSIYNSLCESLQVDISKAKELIGWEPVISMHNGLSKMVRSFLNEKNI